MTSRYFFGNTLAAFSRSDTSVVESTSAGKFDSNYVNNAIFIPNNNNKFLRTMPFLDAASVSTLYMRYDVYTNGAGSSQYPVVFIDSGGTNVAVIKNTGTINVTYQFQYWNGAAFVSHGPAVIVPQNTLLTIAAKIVAGASGTFDMWIGGTKVIVDPATGMNAAFDNIAAVQWNSDGATYISQALGADYDLRDDHYYQRLATGNGHYTAGTGTYTDINETVLDDSTAILLPADTNKKTFTWAGITLPDGYSIAAVCAAARARVSGGTIGDGELLIRNGSTDVLSADLLYNTGYEPRGFYTTTDPNTSAAWGSAGAATAEFGINAEA